MGRKKWKSGKQSSALNKKGSTYKGIFFIFIHLKWVMSMKRANERKNTIFFHTYIDGKLYRVGYGHRQKVSLLTPCTFMISQLELHIIFTCTNINMKYNRKMRTSERK